MSWPLLPYLSYLYPNTILYYVGNANKIVTQMRTPVVLLALVNVSLSTIFYDIRF